MITLIAPSTCFLMALFDSCQTKSNCSIFSSLLFSRWLVSLEAGEHFQVDKQFWARVQVKQH